MLHEPLTTTGFVPPLPDSGRRRPPRGRDEDKKSASSLRFQSIPFRLLVFTTHSSLLSLFLSLLQLPSSNHRNILWWFLANCIFDDFLFISLSPSFIRSRGTLSLVAESHDPTRFLDVFTTSLTDAHTNRKHLTCLCSTYKQIICWSWSPRSSCLIILSNL